MVKHYNTSIAEDAARILNSKQGQFLGDDVTGPVAVIPIQRFCNIVRAGSSAATGAVTVYTTPSDKDFYLVGATLQIQENATSDNTSTSLRCFIDGVLQNLINIRKLTTTATTDSEVLMLPIPIKVDRNTVISISNSFTVGSATKAASIIGYTVETTK